MCASFNTHNPEHWWIPLVFLTSPGVVVVTRAFFRRRRLRKDILDSLEKEVMNISYEELEERMNNSNYELSRPDTEKIKQKEVEEYISYVVNYVMKEENRLLRRPYTLAGLGIMMGGIYLSSQGSPYSGGLIAMLGTAIGITSESKNIIKQRKLKNGVKKIIYEKGYEYLKIHAFNKNPYAFYKKHILPEIESQKQKD